MSAFTLTIWALCALFILRAEIVKRRHCRRISEIHAANLAAIEADRFELSILDRFDDVGSFHADMLDLRKWTYAQFYPQPVARQ